MVESNVLPSTTRGATGGAAKHWCFTVNNPTDESRLIVAQLIENPIVSYVIVGREVGEQGTPHLQGFFSLTARKRFAQVKALFGTVNPHLEVSRNIRASIQYCKKEGDYDEYGSQQSRQGERSDLEAFKEDVKQGNTDLKSIIELHSDVYAKYTRFVIDYVNLHKPKRKIDSHELHSWQQDLNDYLKSDADDRTVVFIVDKIGNKGKTWFAHWFADQNERVQVLQPGKKADMAHCLDESCNVFIFDAPRSKQGEYIQYDFLEDIKNGYVFAPKYESRVKVLEKSHVVVLMNEHPDMTKLSSDRYKIIEI